MDIYYNDTFVTDYALYRNTSRLEEIFQLIERAKVPADHPLLTEYEFTEWRRAMLAAYRSECPRHDPVRYIDEAYVTAFVRDAVPLIDEIYQETFH